MQGGNPRSCRYLACYAARSTVTFDRAGWLRVPDLVPFKTGLIQPDSSGGNTGGRSVSSSAYLSNCQGTGGSPTAPRRCLTNTLREISRPPSEARCDEFCWQSIISLLWWGKGPMSAASAIFEASVRCANIDSPKNMRPNDTP